MTHQKKLFYLSREVEDVLSAIRAESLNKLVEPGSELHLSSALIQNLEGIATQLRAASAMLKHGVEGLYVKQSD